jgi:transposase
VSEVTTIGLDIAKHVFHAHVADATGRAVFSRRLTRGKLLDFFAAHPRCRVALEACGGAHHWARELRAMGQDVRLIPPAYVKPYVRRHKNDAIDAEAICEAAQRPGMRFVAVKSEDQQAAALVFRTRDLAVKQRTQIANAIRGHLAEYGWVAPKGAAHLGLLADLLEDGDAAGSGTADVRDDGRHAGRSRPADRLPGQGDRSVCPRGRGGASANDDPVG